MPDKPLLESMSITQPQGSQELESIPGVGPSIAGDLKEMGIRKVGDLRNRNPEHMYEALCAVRGGKVDRCVLYVFRCAVYYATDSQHDPELLKWWNWTEPNAEEHKNA